MTEQPLKVAILGCGTVGSQVARLILEQGADLAARTGRRLELVGIAIRDANRPRPGLPANLFTADSAALVARGDLDVVIELIGGIEPAGSLIRSAIAHGASVVTANKALLATEGEQLAAAAAAAGVDLYYEAAVAGAIPIIRPLRESLVGDAIQVVMGIVNGTTNYILDKMTTEGMDYATALSQAQELGYAEADPTADVAGLDAGAKAAILASLAFHTQVAGDQVYIEGITQVQPKDIQAAAELNCVVKLLAVAQVLADDRISVRVHPAMVPNNHPLATVSGAHNAIFVVAAAAGRLMFMGPGAGGAPTASAVIGDLVTVARNRDRGVSGPTQSLYAHRQVAPMDAVRTRYYLRLLVRDQPGVLAAVAGIFAEHGVSVQTVQQASAESNRPEAGQLAELGLMTHVAGEADLLACVATLQASPQVLDRVRFMRVEGK